MTPLMNREIKIRWAEALRSGNYVQGFQRLGTVFDVENATTYCCLGVLCELAVEDEIIPRTEATKSYNGGRSILYDGSYAKFLPPSVLEWAGLDAPSGNPTINGVLMGQLNDSHGLTFSDIATLIERYL